METLESSEAAILDRVMRPNLGGWPRAAAEAILTVTFDPQDRERMSQLMEKAKAGDLSAEEAEEMENYRHVGRLLELMKSRARRSLRDAA
jgi:chromosome segregation and condensation protein ScpB